MIKQQSSQVRRRMVALIVVMSILLTFVFIDFGGIRNAIVRCVVVRGPKLYRDLFHAPLPTQSIVWLQDIPTERRVLTDVSEKHVDLSHKPNIVMIIADDLGINDIHGGLGVSTPHIDSLIANGIRFHNAYAGQSTCAPSRAAIFTGRIPTKIGFEFTPMPKQLAKAIALYTQSHPYHPNKIFSDNLNNMPAMASMAIPRNVTTIPEALKPLGYESYLIGKWHLGSEQGARPTDRGFDESLVFPLTLSKYYPTNHPDVINAHAPMEGLFDEFLRENMPYTVSFNNGKPFEPDDYMTDYLTTKAVELIEAREHRPMKPFMLALAYGAAHNPLQARRKDYFDEEVSQIADESHRVYAAMIKSLDRGVGEVLAALRRTNQLDNTIVIFTSDNGGAQYIGVPSTNAPYRGFKCTLFEGGLRIPLLMQWSAQWPKNISVQSVVTHVDLFATIMNAAKDNPAKHNELSQTSTTIDGVDLAPAIQAAAKGSIVEPHDYLFWRSGHYRMLRFRHLKLQIMERPDKVFWYDLDSDPFEKHNLAQYNGIETLSQLVKIFETGFQPFSKASTSEDPIEGDHNVVNLMRMYGKMVQEEASQRSPLWPPIFEAAIPIDKSSSSAIEADDEYIYFVN